MLSLCQCSKNSNSVFQHHKRG